jgi:hypothetical protein
MSEQRVQERAYAIWEGDGRLHGRDLVHWFQAEVEISSTFPESDFRAFAVAASAFFPTLLSDENLADESERRRHFDWSWQAVRYRYRLCTECCGEFKALFAKPSESWSVGWIDEELDYKIERCIYVFFMSALSVLESFVFCLYFIGNAICPNDFLNFDKPRQINLVTTRKAFAVAFPHAAITQKLLELSKTPEYREIEALRNILAHRISGRRNVQFLSAMHSNDTYTQIREEFWHIPGLRKSLSLDDSLLQRHLANIGRLLTAFASASRQFAESKGAA